MQPYAQANFQCANDHLAKQEVSERRRRKSRREASSARQSQQRSYDRSYDRSQRRQTAGPLSFAFNNAMGHRNASSMRLTRSYSGASHGSAGSRDYFDNGYTSDSTSSSRLDQDVSRNSSPSDSGDEIKSTTGKDTPLRKTDSEDSLSTLSSQYSSSSPSSSSPSSSSPSSGRESRYESENEYSGVEPGQFHSHSQNDVALLYAHLYTECR